MNPLITIIVPAYNVEKYIDRCINSIINQSYQNLQVIIVNDGSTDNTWEKCQRYEDKRIEIYKKENGGLSDARNYGLKFAKGEYVAFVDSDDWIDTSMISILYEVIRKYSVKIAVCEPYYAYDDHIYSRQMDGKSFELDKGQALKMLVEDRKFRTNAWNKLYSIDLWERIRFPYGRKYEDVATIYRIYDAVEKVGFINKPLYYYYQRNDSIVHSFNINSYMDYIKGVKERREYLIEKYPEMNDLLDTSIIKSVFDLERDSILNNADIPDDVQRLLRSLVSKYSSRKSIKGLPPRTKVEYYIYKFSNRLYKMTVPLIDDLIKSRR